MSSSSNGTQQHLSVAPDSSGHLNRSMHKNMVLDSPTTSSDATSPSLRAPSTDQDYDRYRSSPSTSFTSTGASVCDYSDGECGVEGHIINNTGQAGSSTSGLPARSWKMPFAKSSAPPHALTTAGPSSSNNRSPPRRTTGKSNNKASASAPKPSVQEHDDGSFVETTSEKAAQALAQYWNEVQAQSNTHGRGMSPGVAASPSANDYVVVARVENGKRIYKIR